MATAAHASPRDDCFALYRQGLEFRKQGNYAKAADALTRASTLGESALGPGSPDLADIFNSLGHLNFSIGRFSDAVFDLQRVLAIREKALQPDDPRIGNSLNDLAFLDDQLGRYVEAETLYKRAMAFQARVHGTSHPDFARVQNNLAVLYLHQARYAEAEPLLKQVTATWEKTLGQAHPDVATSLNNLAGLYDLQGRYEEAEPLIRRVLAMREKAGGAGSADVAQSLQNLARLYSEEGRYVDAVPLLTRALDIRERTLGPTHPDVGTSLLTLATVYVEQHHYDEAEPLLKRALSIRRTALGPTHPDVAQAVNNIAGMYMQEGKYADAEPLFRQALEINEKAFGPDHPEVATSLHNLAYVDERQGRFAEAEAPLKRALLIRENALGPSHPDVASSLNNLAAVYEGEGRMADALDASRRAVAILTGRNAHAEDGRSPTGARERQLARDYFVRLVRLISNSAGADGPSPQLLDEAFRSAQYAGGIETAKAIAGTMARYAAGTDGLVALVREREDLSGRWQKIDADLLQAVSKTPDKRNAATEDALRKEQADVDLKLAADNDKLRVAFPRFAALMEARPVSIADVQDILDPDEAFAAFTLADKQSFLFVIRKRDAHIFRLDITSGDAADSIKTLRDQLTNDQNFDIAASHDLYRKLFGAADALIREQKNLVIVPDGALQSFPFSVLVTALPDGGISKTPDYKSVAWLIRRQALAVQPAASSLVALRRFAPQRRGTVPFVGFGDPIFNGNGARRGIDTSNLYRGREAVAENLRRLPRLPETADELRMEARTLGAPETSVHLGTDASVTTVRTLDLSNVRVVSFATHGLIAGELPKLAEPALVLTPPANPSADDDGLLRSSQVAQLRLDADFVILSACNTAAASGAPGAEGLSGLAKAFFYAGARSLLVSHWPVESEATVTLTTGLVRAAADAPAIGRAEALRRTILAMIDGGADQSHPFRWAPFVLAGEGGVNR